MKRIAIQLHSALLGAACVLSLGCSANRLTVHQDSPAAGIPSPQQTVSTPGTSDVEVGDELRHPATVFIAYARWQEQQRQLPQARESFEKALKHDPRSVEALMGLSRLDRLAGRNAEAERHLTQAEKLRPGDPLVSAAWGEHYAATGRLTEAVNRYKYAVEKSPDESLFKHQLAVVLTRSGDVQGGLAMFAKVIHPAEAHYNVGYLLQSQGKLLEAEAQYQRALALNPNLVQASNMLSKVRQERGVPDTQFAQKPSIAKPLPQVTAQQSLSRPQTETTTAVWQSQSSRGDVATASSQDSDPVTFQRPTNSASAAPSAAEEQRRNQQF